MSTDDSRTPRSMAEVHSSVATTHPSLWKRMFAFLGPAYLVSVGYMDPGNWATDLEGGARFGYQLLWVLVLSNAMAILLQTLSARLGIVTGRDLAQACRDSYPRPVSWGLWVLCEVAIAACDLAEVLGAAIGMNLLFGLPLVAGVVVTAFDTLLVLWFTRFGIRLVESIILGFITVIALCFLAQVILVRPDFAQVASGLIPRLNDESLYVAIGILGATVMPHNLYLHSSLVQTRRIAGDIAAKRDACRFNFVDSVIALNGAFLVNAAILILAATVFYQRGIVVTEIQQAHQLLSPLVGTTLAGILFAVALLCSGQSSTITGTMAGQIVMEGFLNFRMRAWLRRLVTRLVAVVPAVATILVAGDQATYRLLILSQVILSLQLPFAVIPLIRFTSDRRRMGEFASAWWVKALAWTCGALIVGLNARLAWTTLGGWIASAGEYRWLVSTLLLALVGALAVLLGYVVFEPWIRRGERAARPAMPPAPSAAAVAPYRRVLVCLDHSPQDRVALGHALALARPHGAEVHLLHVEEGVASQVYGSLASTGEVEEGRRYFEAILADLTAQGVRADLHVVHGDNPPECISRLATDLKPDLLVMAAHGHKGIQDILFGATIDAVRHKVAVPVLVVGPHRAS
jgi:manganese transport protein